MNKFYVYALKDSDENIFYVGMGSNGRATSHLAWSHNKSVNEKILEASEGKQKISIEIISWHETKKEAIEEEKNLIKSFPPNTLSNIVHVNKEIEERKKKAKLVKNDKSAPGKKAKRIKTAIIHIRLYPEQKAWLIEQAKVHGMSLTKYVHEMLLPPTPSSRKDQAN